MPRAASSLLVSWRCVRATHDATAAQRNARATQPQRNRNTRATTHTAVHPPLPALSQNQGSNADRDGRVCEGDRLLRVSAVQFVEQSSLLTVGPGTQFTKWNRTLIPCTALDFDTIMAAIASNDGRYGYVDVVLQLQRTDRSVARPSRPASERLRADAAAAPEWSGAKGLVTPGGLSTPVRVPEEDF